MYLNKEVRSYAQFQLSDDTGIGREAGTDVVFQTGLRFGDDRPKPGWTRSGCRSTRSAMGNNVTVWGGVRPGARKRVAIQAGEATRSRPSRP